MEGRAGPQPGPEGPEGPEGPQGDPPPLDLVQLRTTDDTTDYHTDQLKAIPWDGTVELQRGDALVLDSADPSRLLVQQEGVYDVRAHVAQLIDSEIRTNIRVRLAKNGQPLAPWGQSSYIRNQRNHRQSSTSVQSYLACAAGDALRVVCDKYDTKGRVRLQPDGTLFETRRLGD